MRQIMKKALAYVLSCCMALGMAQIPAVTGHAADGAIDTSVERMQTLTYYKSDTGTEVTAPIDKSEHLKDFFEGTETMGWSVDFKTTQESQQMLLALEDNSHHWGIYVRTEKDGKKTIGVSASIDNNNGGNNLLSSREDNIYADGNWHTVKVTVTKGQGSTLSLDGRQLASYNYAPVCIDHLSWTPSAFTIGGLTQNTSAGSYAFSGSIRNVVLTKEVPLEMDPPTFEKKSPESGSAVNTSVSELDAGGVHLTYRLADETQGRVSLLKLGDAGELYLDAAAGKVGLQSGGQSVEATVENTALGTEKWHNLTVSKSEGQVQIYVDGTLAGSGALTGNIKTSQIIFGKDACFSGMKLYNTALSEKEVKFLHENTDVTKYPDTVQKADEYEKGPNRELFNAGYDGSISYRIPAIVTSQKTGTVIASIDKRWNGSGDIGQIDTVIRRSEDNGHTWGDLITVIDLKDPYGYTVDPAMLVDNNENSPHYGRIYILADMFMRDTGFGGAQAGTGFTEVDGVNYQTLTGKDQSKYTVRENGVVYDSQNQETAYRVELESKQPFKTQGDLYKDGQYVGNIYDRKNELAIFDTTYLWVTYSDDDGLTWSVPKNITPMVKSDWMRFCGAGPGIGICTKEGRLIFPVYCTNTVMVLNKGEQEEAHRQSSFNIYSDDGGETWKAGGSPNNGGDMEHATSELTESCIVELDNGHLIQFMRSYNGKVTTSVSTDAGLTWSPIVTHEGILDPYCQMAAVHYPGKLYDPEDKKEKEAIIFSNPNSGSREKGTVRIAFVNPDDTLTWKYSKMVEQERYNYSSVTVMNDGNIGVFYEHEKANSTSAAFTYFSPQYLMDANTYEITPLSKGIKAKVKDASGKDTDELAAGNQLYVEVAYDQNVFAAGNVTLNVKVGSEVREASLIGNVDSDTLAFSYTFTDADDGVVTATAEVNIKEGGVAENIYNVSLTDKPIVNRTVTLGRISVVAGLNEMSVEGMTATAGSEHAQSGVEGPASNVLDNSTNTWWHSKYDADNAPEGRSKHWITINLGARCLVSGLVYTPRSNGNGTVTQYQIEVSTDGENFVPVAFGNWVKDNTVKTADFGGTVVASHVMLRVIETNDKWATAAEIRIIGNKDSNLYEDKTELLQVLTAAASYGDNLNKVEIVEGLQKTLAAAKDVAKDTKADAATVKKAAEDVGSLLKAVADKAKEELQTEIDKAAVKAEENYNMSSWAAHKEALKKAQALTDDASEKEIIQAYLGLVAAEKDLYLNKAGNEALIEKIREEAENTKNSANEIIEQGEDKYTEESLSSYKNVYDRLVSALQRGADGNSLNALMDELSEAAKNLKEKEKDPGKDPGADPGKDPGKDPSADPGKNPGKNPGADPGQNSTPVLPPSSVTQTPAEGKVYSVGNLKYKVTSLAGKTAELAGAVNKAKVTKLKVPKTVKILEVTFKVTSIGAKAFAKCKKLKDVTIGANVTKIGKQAFSGCGNLKKIAFKTKMMKSVGAKAFKGISKKAVIRVPKPKKAAYIKLLKKKGQPAGVKIR